MRMITAIASTLIAVSAAVGVTHSIMQEHEREAVARVTVSAFNDGFMDGACTKGSDGFGHVCLDIAASDYTTQVVKATETYGPCVDMVETDAGRAAYAGLVSDDTDHGHRRALADQIQHVKRGCDNA